MSEYYKAVDNSALLKRINELEQQLRDEREEHKDIYLKMKADVEYYSSNNIFNDLEFFRRENEKLKRIIHEGGIVNN